MKRTAEEAAALAAWKGKPKRGTTGPGGAGSSPVARAEPEPDTTEGGEGGTILRASQDVRTEWARRWRAGESVFLVHYHHAGRTRLLCCDADELLRVFARAARASSHSIDVFTEPDTEG